MTKSELLASMIKLGACGGARDYVSRHASEDALTIGLECGDIDWLIWYLGRRDPVGIAAFARRCADRSGSRSAAQYADSASADAIVATAAAADYEAAASAAASAARATRVAAIAAIVTIAASFARATVAERAEQLRDLHEMWAELVGGEK